MAWLNHSLLERWIQIEEHESRQKKRKGRQTETGKKQRRGKNKSKQLQGATDMDLRRSIWCIRSPRWKRVWHHRDASDANYPLQLVTPHLHRQIQHQAAIPTPDKRKASKQRQISKNSSSRHRQERKRPQHWNLRTAKAAGRGVASGNERIRRRREVLPLPYPNLTRYIYTHTKGLLGFEREREKGPAAAPTVKPDVRRVPAGAGRLSVAAHGHSHPRPKWGESRHHQAQPTPTVP
jgi:hypothetical protein